MFSKYKKTKSPELKTVMTPVAAAPSPAKTAPSAAAPTTPKAQLQRAETPQPSAHPKVARKKVAAKKELDPAKVHEREIRKRIADLRMQMHEVVLDSLNLAELNKISKEQLRREVTMICMEYINLNKIALNKEERGEMEDARLEMIRAGFYNEDAVRIFSFAKLAGGLGGLALGFVLYNLFTDPEEPSMQQMLMMIGLPGMVGYFLPKMHANSKRQKRIDQIAMGFPDALDMMLVCVEAGQTMDQAIPRVGKELRSSYEFLADELETVAHQIKAGKDRATVLREFANRCDNDDVMAFVNTLITAQSFGKSISDALRVYTLEMRDKRVMVAEEKANKIPTKMTLCTMAFTLPPLLIVLVGPAIVTILDVVNQ